ncbi:hypothetical protein PN466_19715 [Roseofilum reptotaenium CS-1145]|uniref:Uncharacterized protein n=1 Tax=Roseofilum reptotaenium AO1-A TaxID=1925591 RepID=A0A1L9QXD1_9CYAN|nr:MULTISPECIES: hypothetical protein [Roseofilum]MBP0029937.1 hypothetical protein [Roseofilum sp. Guam]MDB9519176.1 hypothetical protein [Roseofilum reptotaenium CS-1145]OJJ27313.1 hypothetical protein BI308_02185 [Roseofilum reptotaenium AO1-A]
MEFVVCINNQGYPASLELRKIYQTLPDRHANLQDMIRVIDESGEDYLYPQGYFMPIELSEPLATALCTSIKN